MLEAPTVILIREKAANESSPGAAEIGANSPTCRRSINQMETNTSVRELGRFRDSHCGLFCGKIRTILDVNDAGARVDRV